MKKYGFFDAVLSLMFAVMLALNLAQVVFRYVLNDPLSWSEEASIFLMIAIVFLGMALLVRDRDHIVIDLVGGVRSAGTLRWLNVAGTAATVVIMAVFGFLVFEYLETLVRRNTTSTALRIPMWLPVGTMLLGTLGSVIYAALRLVRILKAGGEDAA